MAAHQASCAHGRALPAPFGKRSLLAHLSARWVCTRWRRARVLDTERRQGQWLAVQERRAALRAQMRCTTSTGQRHPERAARPAWRRACSCATRLADRAQRPGCHLAAGCSALPCGSQRLCKLRGLVAPAAQGASVPHWRQPSVQGGCADELPEDELGLERAYLVTPGGPGQGLCHNTHTQGACRLTRRAVARRAFRSRGSATASL